MSVFWITFVDFSYQSFVNNKGKIKINNMSLKKSIKSQKVYPRSILIQHVITNAVYISSSLQSKSIKHYLEPAPGPIDKRN